MKKIFVLLSIVFVLSSCGEKKEVVKKNIDSVEKTSSTQIEKQQEKNISKFDLDIIKIAVQKGVENCKYANNKQLCENLTKKEKSNLENLKCDKLLVFKQECLDKLNFRNFECDKIKDFYLKKQCNFEKLYKQAIKNKNTSFCRKLPRIKRNECYSNME